MSDLISRKALIKELQELSTLEAISDRTGDMMFWVDKKAVYKIIENLPTIQPQGIDKDRLIEFLKEQLRDWEDMKFRYVNGADCGLSAIEDVLEWVNQQPTTDGWIPVSSEGRKGLLGRVAEYFKEWDGQEPAPTMQMSIDDLRTIAAMNVERCALQEEVRKLRLPQPYKESE